ncbi:MAG: ROK family protein [Planctomycetota bacterium]|nr:MAG: ROK family protein [Planctomycetota bacterium]
MPARSSASPLLGIDLGGSKILAVVMDDQGRILGRAKRRTKPKQGYSRVLERLQETAKRALEDAGFGMEDVRAVGVGLPGPVLPECGDILGAVNLGWGRKPIAHDLSQLFDGLPVAIGNDVNFGALGEATYGIAAGTASSYALFMGTGLGGALVINGALQVGTHGFAGELGHLPGPFDNALCICGQYGCLETVASKTGIARLLQAAKSSGASCLIDDDTLQDLRSSHLRKAWDDGCTTVRETIKTAAEALAWGINVASLACDPEVVILGGGVVEELGEEMLPIIQTALQKYSYRAKQYQIDVRIACLDADAVAIGAVAAAQQEVVHD